MKNILKFKLTILIIILLASVSWSQTARYGGKGLFRTLSAEPAGAGNLFVNGYFSGYMKKQTETYMTKDYTFSTAATFGFSKHFETYLMSVLYQDDQQSIWAPPGDMRLGLKYHFPFSGPAFHLGLNTFAVIPTSKYYNLMYEPYSSGKFGWGAQFLSTISFANVMPMLPMKIHLNAGYLDHSIKDNFFADSTDQVIIGAGIVFPVRSFQLFTEFTGEIFINEPDVQFAQNSMRVTQGFKFLGPKNLIFDLIFDFGLTNEDSLRNIDESQKLKHPLWKDYADWKVVFGATYHFSLKRFFEKDVDDAKKKELEEQRKLERIKNKREKAKTDLDSMKRALDGKLKTSPQNPPEKKDNQN